MYRIWTKVYHNGEYVGASVSAKPYIRKGNAENAAKRMYAPHGDMSFDWVVSETNPFVEE